MGNLLVIRIEGALQRVVQDFGPVREIAPFRAAVPDHNHRQVSRGKRAVPVDPILLGEHRHRMTVGASFGGDMDDLAMPPPIAI